MSFLSGVHHYVCIYMYMLAHTELFGGSFANMLYNSGFGAGRQGQRRMGIQGSQADNQDQFQIGWLILCRSVIVQFMFVESDLRLPEF